MLRKIISLILIIGLMASISNLTAYADNSVYRSVVVATNVKNQTTSQSAVSILKYVVSSNKKYNGETKQDGNFSAAEKFSVTFTNFNEKTCTFNGKIEWVGYNVKDDISGKIDGDKLVYKQTARYQNGRKISMDVTITMKIESNSKISGKWVDNKTGKTGTCWFGITLPEKQPPKVVPTPQPTNGIDDILKYIVSSSEKYNGIYSRTDKLIITFTNFNEKTRTFNGKIEWVGANTTDQISGKIDGDKIVFRPTARYQNGKKTSVDATITMKVYNNNRVSGSWVYKSGVTAAIWFEFTPPSTAVEDIDFTYDDNGFPTGDVEFECGNNIQFDGEVKVVSDNFIAIGTINYPDGIEIIGRFVNGKPDGLCSIIYPDDKAYLIDFVYGQPVNAYVANNIPDFQGDELAIYKADEVNVFKADDINEFQADNIDEFHADDIDWFIADDIDEFIADDIQPYKAEMIKLFQAEQIKEFKADSVKLRAPTPTNFDIPVGGFTSPDLLNPVVMEWQTYLTTQLPFLTHGDGNWVLR